MTQDNVVELVQPGAFSDPLTEVLREGARALLAQAVEAEVAAFLAGHADKHTEDGRQRLVRHGHRPERKIVTGLGPVCVLCASALLLPKGGARAAPDCARPKCRCAFSLRPPSGLVRG